MIDELKWLARADELELEKKNFRGKLAGKSWKYAQNLRALIRTRAIILLMSVIVYYPIISEFAYHSQFRIDLLKERFIYSILFLISGLLFNKFRIISLLLAAILLIHMVHSYIVSPNDFDLRQIADATATLLIVLIGIYHHIQLLKLKRILEESSIE